MIKKYKLLLFFSAVLNLLLIGFYLGKRIYYANFSYFHPAKTSDERWQDLLNTKVDNHGIFFIGTSITYGFPVENLFADSSIKNAGFAGATTNDIVFNVAKILTRHPEKMFIEAGINDIRYHLNTDNAYKNLLEIINKTHSASPRTTLYIQSVLPTNDDVLNKEIVAFNTGIMKLCHDNNVMYINLYPSFLRNGRIDNALTIDGVHLSYTGYFVWRNAVEQYL